jgi:SAM-dependent methyltransferase
MPSLSRVKNFRDHSERVATERNAWIDRNRYFHESDWEYLRLIVPEGARVLEVGCGTGRLLDSLKPKTGVGVDLSEAMVARAHEAFPTMTFHTGDAHDPGVFNNLNGPFDFIILSDTIGYLDDFQTVLVNLRQVSHSGTRVVISYYSVLWRPLVRLASTLRLMMPTPQRNWLSLPDIADILTLAGYDIVRTDTRQILPFNFFGVGPMINSSLGRLPFVRSLGIRNYTVARLLPDQPLGLRSISVIIPARNEKGNIAPAIARMPDICDDVEIIFVEGHSSDGTLDEIRRVAEENPDKDIKYFVQDGVGKGDAVRKGFREARGDVLVIQDADLTAPPEALTRFFDVLNSGKGEFANGSRLVYPMEKEAMRALNYFANKTFAWMLSWMIGQRMTDTLCGTKALLRRNYEDIERNRSYFGDFDPFGDFDLIFGSAKKNLKVVNIPLRYFARDYGTTQISRFQHGWQLLKMVVFAWRKFVKA